MQQPTYASRLRYLDADDLDDSEVDFDGLEVRGTDGDKLGEVDGFLVEPGSGRVLYTVVDSGGWFTSKRLLVPIGHAEVDRERPALRLDVTREHLGHYPKFDEARFRQFSDEELRTYEQRMAAICCPDDARAEGGAWRHDAARHYQQPAWWPAGAYTASRLRPIEPGSFRTRPGARVAAPEARESFDREQVTAHAADRLEASDDVSPHYGGRAQPGDILGIETGGETTGIGDTAADEDKRRRDADRSGS